MIWELRDVRIWGLRGLGHGEIEGDLGIQGFWDSRMLVGELN